MGLEDFFVLFFAFSEEEGERRGGRWIGTRSRKPKAESRVWTATRVLVPTTETRVDGSDRQTRGVFFFPDSRRKALGSCRFRHLKTCPFCIFLSPELNISRRSKEKGRICFTAKVGTLEP
jgi:hypothetical protein